MATMPSASSLFSAYASFSATVMLVRSVVYQVVPQPIRNYLVSAVLYFIKRPSPGKLTLAIEEDTGMARNEVFDAAEVYLSSKVGPNTKRLRISKTPNETGLTIKLHDGEKVSDNYDGVSLAWSFVSSTESSDNPKDPRRPHKNVKRQFELSFAKEHRDKVLNSYLPFVMEQSKVAKAEDKGVKLFTLGSYGYGAKAHWDSVNMEHPATFDKLAMDPNVKRAVVEDLDRFVKRKEFYKKVGRAWKRGYLLYGPPGTGKSSLVAAMANHLKFDIYDLQLANIMRDSDLRRLLLATSNRSILVIEDIDCSAQLPDRHQGPEGRKPLDLQLTLSGLLNFIDGLWSSCGDERIIIFTTNHREKLDPALLRPGRMDLHIHMSYCTSDGFSLLANNYLGISAAGTAHSHLLGEIGHLMTLVQVTPAQVAEELMKNEDPTTALGEVVNLLKRKGVEGNEQSEDRDVADHKGGKKHKSADVITENGICTE